MIDITAWRCWRSIKRTNTYAIFSTPERQQLQDMGKALPEGVMYSLFYPFAWQSPSVLSFNQVSIHNKIGFHALKKERLHPLFLGNIVTPDFVIGQVSLSGTVVEHQGGWRSDRQTIIELHVPYEQLVAPYEELYQCDVHVMKDIWDFFISQNSALEIRHKDLISANWPNKIITANLMPMWALKGWKEDEPG